MGQAATKLIIESDAGEPIFTYIRNGREGNFETVYRMIHLIIDATQRDKGLEVFVKRHLIKDFAEWREAEPVLKRIFNFVQKNVKYIPDISGRVEAIKSARKTLADGFGDCDDYTVLIATILGMIGYEDVRIVLARQSAINTSFNHVYPVVYVNDKRYVLDTGYKGFNDEIPAIEYQEVPVFQNNEIIDELTSALFRVKNAIVGDGGKLVSSLPALTQLLPFGLGFVGSQILTQATGMLSGGMQKSPNCIGSEVIAKLDDIIQKLYSGELALDHAQILAKKAVSELEAVRQDTEIFSAVKSAIAPKLQVILNFDKIAEANGIPIKYLNGKAMLFLGAAALGGGVLYYFYRSGKLKRFIG